MIKVLIIDDEPEIIKILSRIIEGDYQNATIDEAKDGLQGLVKAQETQYDVICTDYNMPNMNGIDFLRSLKYSDTKNKNTLLLFITGYSPQLDVDPVLWNNVYFIEKPFSNNKILNYIKMKKVKMSA